MRRAVLLLLVVSVALVLGSGAALAAVKLGTGGSDDLRGTGMDDVLHGRSGHDALAGMGGDDVLYGGDGRDALHGGSFRFDEIFEGRRMVPDGEDKLFGGDGDDCVWGGSGDDIVHAGSGDDFLGTYCLDFILDTGNDVMYAGSGDDSIIAAEAPFRAPASLQERDIVHCGPGRDEIFYVKGVDRIFDCEVKNPR